jgi:hypothetical protein
MCDGSALVDIDDSAYDFLLSSHNLEHFANPVKGLERMAEGAETDRSSSSLASVLLRHIRPPETAATVEHMLNDFDRGIQEDDLTHLPDILEKHDLTMDVAAGSKQDFISDPSKKAANFNVNRF